MAARPARPNAVPELARGLALWQAGTRATGIYRHPVCRLFGEAPPDFAARMGPTLEPAVAALVDLVLRRLPRRLAARVAAALGVPDPWKTP